MLLYSKRHHLRKRICAVGDTTPSTERSCSTEEEEVLRDPWSQRPLQVCNCFAFVFVPGARNIPNWVTDPCNADALETVFGKCPCHDNEETSSASSGGEAPHAVRVAGTTFFLPPVANKPSTVVSEPPRASTAPPLLAPTLTEHDPDPDPESTYAFLTALIHRIQARRRHPRPSTLLQIIGA